MVPSGLICPSCKCPVAVASGRSTGMHCPRCNTWLDIDPLCNGGSCFACHKAHEAETAVCVETVSSQIGRGEISAPNVVQRSSGEWAIKSELISAPKRLWKSIYHKLFPVR